MDKEGQLPLSAYAPASLVHAFMEVAGEQGRSKSSALREAVKSYVASHREAGPPAGSSNGSRVSGEPAREQE